MTTNPTPAVDREAFRKRYRNFAADATMLRSQHLYRQAWLSRHAADNPEPHDYQQLGERYRKLLDEWCTDAPDTVAGVADYINLVAVIIAGHLAYRYDEAAAPPISLEIEQVSALELLSSALRWLNHHAIDEEVTYELTRRAKGEAGAGSNQ